MAGQLKTLWNGWTRPACPGAALRLACFHPRSSGISSECTSPFSAFQLFTAQIPQNRPGSGPFAQPPRPKWAKEVTDKELPNLGLGQPLDEPQDANKNKHRQPARPVFGGLWLHLDGFCWGCPLTKYPIMCISQIQHNKVNKDIHSHTEKNCARESTSEMRGEHSLFSTASITQIETFHLSKLTNHLLNARELALVLQGEAMT